MSSRNARFSVPHSGTHYSPTTVVYESVIRPPPQHVHHGRFTRLSLHLTRAHQQIIILSAFSDESFPYRPVRSIKPWTTVNNELAGGRGRGKGDGCSSCSTVTTGFLAAAICFHASESRVPDTTRTVSEAAAYIHILYTHTHEHGSFSSVQREIAAAAVTGKKKKDALSLHRISAHVQRTGCDSYPRYYSLLLLLYSDHNNNNNT